MILRANTFTFPNCTYGIFSLQHAQKAQTVKIVQFPLTQGKLRRKIAMQRTENSEEAKRQMMCAVRGSSVMKRKINM